MNPRVQVHSQKWLCGFGKLLGCKMPQGLGTDAMWDSEQLPVFSSPSGGAR